MAQSATLAQPGDPVRRALLEAGCNLLSARRIEDVTIEQLAAVAGVTKGAFHTHFVDRAAFARAVSTEIRNSIEELIALFDEDVSDPLEHLAGGMIVSAAFALADPARTAILIVNPRVSAPIDYPLNQGLVGDLVRLAELGLIPSKNVEVGVVYWLGCCRAVMTAITERRATLVDAAGLLSQMLSLSLAGLGVNGDQVNRVADLAFISKRLGAALEVHRRQN